MTKKTVKLCSALHILFFTWSGWIQNICQSCPDLVRGSQSGQMQNVPVPQPGQGQGRGVTAVPPAGWCEGERLRDGQRGWFPSECAREITCRATLDRNVERMGRLLGLETNV